MTPDKFTILTVEDEPPMLKAIDFKLTKEGFKVLKATDGEKGLKLALLKHPDLILLDILLPKIDGLTMLKKLRQDEWGKKVPVILLTNLVMDDRVTRRIVEDHPAYYLAKSEWRLDDVIAKIKLTLKI